MNHITREIFTLKDILIKYIIKENCFLEDNNKKFILASGRRSNYYINLKNVILNNDALTYMCEIMSKFYKYCMFDSIAGIELGSVPIASMFSMFLYISEKKHTNPLIIRKNKKDRGTNKLIEGNFKKGSKILLLEDVTTTGQSALNAANLILDNGADIFRVCAIVDRLEGAKENFKKQGIAFESILTINDLIEYRDKENVRFQQSNNNTIN